MVNLCVIFVDGRNLEMILEVSCVFFRVAVVLIRRVSPFTGHFGYVTSVSRLVPKLLYAAVAAISQFETQNLSFRDTDDKSCSTSQYNSAHKCFLWLLIEGREGHHRPRSG